MDIKKALQKDIPECYFNMSTAQGTMVYYMLYEYWAGEPEADSERHFRISGLPGAELVINELNDLMHAFYVDGTVDSDELLSRARELRECIKNRAMQVATYTDCVRLYEYIINRVKPDGTVVAAIDNDIASRDILSAIFASQDNPTINENIRHAVAQLPVRITKTKFFDIASNSLKKYIGNDESSFDRELYMLRSAAGIYERDGNEFTELENMLTELAAFDYGDISENDFKAAEAVLTEAVNILNDLSEFHQSTEQVLNYLIVALDTVKSVDPELAESVKAYTPVVDEACKGIKSDETAGEMSDVALECMRALEGKFEAISERLQNIEARMDSALKKYHEDDLEELIKRIEECGKLMSASVFADLDEPDSILLSEERALTEIDRFEHDLSEVLSAGSRQMNRARMAAVLSQLPMFFNSRTEVMNYVRESLESCRDVYEKATSVQLVLGYNK